MTKLEAQCRTGEEDPTGTLSSLISEDFPDLGTLDGTPTTPARTSHSGMWLPPLDNNTHGEREEGYNASQRIDANPMHFLAALYNQVARGGTIHESQLKEMNFQDPAVKKVLEITLEFLAQNNPNVYVSLFGRDPLTGTYTKGKFDQQLVPEAVQRAAAHGTPLSYALIDFDHFKKVNDTVGHPAGDAVLRRGAYLLLRSVRDEAGGRDTENIQIARIGGDEFAAILPGISYQEATRVGERWRKAIDGLPDDVNGYKVPHTTLSIGVTEHKKGMTAEELKKIADAAAYISKRGGRNQVTAYDGKNVLAYTGIVRGELQTPDTAVQSGFDGTAGNMAARIISQASEKMYSKLVAAFRSSFAKRYSPGRVGAQTSTYGRCSA